MRIGKGNPWGSQFAVGVCPSVLVWEEGGFGAACLSHNPSCAEERGVQPLSQVEVHLSLLAPAGAPQAPPED